MPFSLRFEYKFLLCITKKNAIMAALGSKLRPDLVGGTHGKYPIVSLYYDTPDLDCYWEHWRGVPSRRKLRVRAYGSDNGAIPATTFIEIKHKFDGRSSKRRLSTTCQEALRIANGDTPSIPLTPSDARVATEAHSLSQNGYRPTALMRYNRTAYYLDQPFQESVRITFDEDVRIRLNNLYLTADDPAFINEVFPSGTNILELKGTQSIPAELALLLSSLQIYSRPISKYVEGLRRFHTQLNT